MFIGEYNHSIDTKGRVIVPSKFREQLDDVCFATKGLDGCLFVFPKTEWEAFEEKLKALPVSNKEARKFARFFLTGAAEIEIDKQGRALIPANLREFAGLEKEVCLVGVSGRFEIWNAKAWEESNTFDNMDEIAEHMGEWGFEI